MERAAISPDLSDDSEIAAKPTNDIAAAFVPFIQTNDEGDNSLTLAVSGIHCARCIHAIESYLHDEEDVTSARVNMSTSRLHLSWHGSADRIATYAQKIIDMGYPLQPIESKNLQELSEDARLLRCVAVAGFGMGNIMLLSVALWSSNQHIMGIALRDLFHWVSALIALPVIAYAGRPFFQSALGVLRHGRTNMDVPISLALLLACGMSLSETLHHGEHAYFDSAVMLLFFLLCGRWLDARARGKARAGAEELLERMQGVATIQEGCCSSSRKSIKMSELRPQMTLLIAAGEKIAADAEILEGDSEIDMSLLNGETVPRHVSQGDKIYAGTINLSAPLKAKILKPNDDSMLAQVVQLMEQAEQGRAHYVRLADKAARLYTPVVHSLAAGAFLGWFVLGGMAWQDALLIAITTLIITCPCALGLAVPVVQVLTSGWLMKRGVLLKTGDALERLAVIDTVVCDKTGTLTSAQPTLCSKPDDPSLFQLAASLAAHSHHPLSKAIANAFEGNHLALKDIQEIAGHGMQATLNAQETVQLGKADWCGDAHSHHSEQPELWLARNGKPLGVFRFEAPLLDGATDLVHYFQSLKLPVYLLSGDAEAVVRSVASQLNIQHAQGGLLPADKHAIIQQLRSEGKRVLMIGDGLNDAAAMTAANLSIAPSGGMDITQNAADIVLQKTALAPVISTYRIARFSTKLVKQNFALAVLYNCFAIPLAVAGYVTPLIAAIAMSSSSLIVIANSFRINLQKDLFNG